MTDRDYEKWIELHDRQTSGATLNANERELYVRMLANDPLCAREVELLDELSNLEAQPDAGARAREEAVLAAVWGEASITHDKPTTHATTSSARSWITPRVRTALKLSATLAAAAAVALVVGAGIGYWQRSAIVSQPAQPSRVELVYASGDVQVQSSPAAFGQLLAEGNVVRVNEGAACLAIDPGIDVCLGKHSTLRVTRTAVADRRVDLLQGNVTAAIDPQPTGARFSIVADNVWSTAVGTAFSVSKHANGQVQTAVLSGKVLVGPKDKQQVVGAHQLAKTGHSQTTLKALSRAEESPYWASIKTTALWAEPGTATLQIHDDHEHANVWLDGEAIGLSPLSSLIPAGEHRLTAVLNNGTSLERSFMIAAGKQWSLDLNAELATLAASEHLKARVADLPSIGHKKTAMPDAVVTQAGITPAAELLSRARQQMRASDWQGATATYRQLRVLHAGTAEAHTALVPLSQLAMDKLDQPAVALRELDAYLTQGGGALTQEARYLRIRALRATGKTAMANDAVRAFLDDYPQSFQSETLRRELRQPASTAATDATPPTERVATDTAHE